MSATSMARGSMMRRMLPVGSRRAQAVGVFGAGAAVMGGLTLGGGYMLGSAALGGARNYTARNEAEIMGRMILRTQSGPFGPAGLLNGIPGGRNNSAGMTLAAHYAQRRNKAFGVLGLRYL